MNKNKLIEIFAKIGLVLQILTQPIRSGRGMANIFQMDIQAIKKGIQRYEKFRMYIGNPNTTIQVRSTDAAKRQLVLLVKEPVSTFEETIAISTGSLDKVTAKILRINKAGPRTSNITILNTTLAQTRYFLMGVDERQLFIAQLSGPATTVKEARSLLGRTVKFAEGSRRNSLDRQGEWFFLEAPQHMREQIEFLLRRNKTAIHRKASIGSFFGRVGNPHTAEELVVIPSNLSVEGKRVRRENNRIYIRGTVRHKDHKTVRFSNWREVIANNESVGRSNGSMTTRGIFWID